MKIKDFIDAVENLYLGCSMETRVCCDYSDTIPQWIGVERYTLMRTAKMPFSREIRTIRIIQIAYGLT